MTGEQYAGDRRWRPAEWLLFPSYLKHATEPDQDPAFGPTVLRIAAASFILTLGLAVVFLSTVLHTSTP